MSDCLFEERTEESGKPVKHRKRRVQKFVDEDWRKSNEEALAELFGTPPAGFESFQTMFGFITCCAFCDLFLRAATLVVGLVLVVLAAIHVF